MNVKAVIAATCIALMPVAAEAEEPGRDQIPAKARALADRGRAYHDAGDYANAVEAFKAAYVIAPSAALLFNLAQAYRLEGDCDDAALMYQRYIASEPDPDGRTLAEAHLATVERCLHKIGLHIPTETPKLVEATPTPAPRVVADTRAPSRTARIEKDVGLGLAIGGGVALSFAGYYAYEAHDASNQVANAYAHGAKWKDIAPIDARGRDNASSAKVLAIGGGIGVASGIALYVLGKRAESVPLRVTAARTGGEVSVRWHF